MAQVSKPVSDLLRLILSHQPTLTTISSNNEVCVVATPCTMQPASLHNILLAISMDSPPFRLLHPVRSPSIESHKLNFNLRHAEGHCGERKCNKGCPARLPVLNTPPRAVTTVTIIAIPLLSSPFIFSLATCLSLSIATVRFTCQALLANPLFLFAPLPMTLRGYRSFCILARPSGLCSPLSVEHAHRTKTNPDVT